MFYDLATNSFSEEEMKAILKVLRTGNFLAGEHVDRFEKEMTVKLGAKYAVMVNSGSSAMLLALASLFYKKDKPLKKGDEVILPAVIFPSLCAPIQQLGLKMKFVDVDMQTLTMDTQYLERAMSPNTKALIACNTFGNPANLDSIKTFCKSKNLYFIEDNTEGLGAEYKGKKCGTYGDIGILSTGHSHQISTMEGGMILTDDREFYHLAKGMRAYGWVKNLPPESPLFQKKVNDPFEAYRAVVPGFNVRPLELTGAVGSEQLKKLDYGLGHRRNNRAVFQQVFQNDPRFLLQRDNGKSSWHGFTIIVNSMLNIDFANLMKVLNNEGIECAPINNIVQQSVIRFYEHECVSDLRISNMAAERGFYVGNHAADLTKQIAKLYKTLAVACGGEMKKAA